MKKLSNKEVETIKEIKEVLAKYLNLQDYDMFLFGSRVGSKARKYSDYDIGIKGISEIDMSTLGDINYEIENSRIPYVVDIVDFNDVDDNFSEVALQETINIKDV